jgi:hypothetical protein
MRYDGLGHIDRALDRGFYVCHGPDGPRIHYHCQYWDKQVATYDPDAGWTLTSDDETLNEKVRDALRQAGAFEEETP